MRQIYIYQYGRFPRFTSYLRRDTQCCHLWEKRAACVHVDVCVCATCLDILLSAVAYAEGSYGSEKGRWKESYFSLYALL